MNWSICSFNELSGFELYEIMKLRVDVFIVEQNCPYHDLDGFDYEATHIFCKDASGIVAYARILPMNVKYNDPSIGRVIVRQDSRGTGIAHHLMERSVKAVLTDWGPEKIRLQAQSHLSEFYKKHGFIVVSEPYEEDGIPHVDMIFTCKNTLSF